MSPARSSAAGLVALVAITLGCGGSDDRIVVFAASSLSDVVERLEIEFEATHRGVDVVVNTAGSSSLVAQLADGAPVDVLATADLETMAAAQRGGSFVGEPVVFARNDLVIAVERGNPLGVERLSDLAGDLVVVLAAPDVPAGEYARLVLACAGVEIDPASFEQSVRAVAAKVTLGEADAGLVYRTDITDDLEPIDVPTDCQVDVVYPIATVSDDPVAAEFVEFVLGPAGTAALAEAGFGRP